MGWLHREFLFWQKMSWIYVVNMWLLFQPLEVVQVCVPLTVKSDETTSYKVTLMAFVSSAADWPIQEMDADFCCFYYFDFQVVKPFFLFLFLLLFVVSRNCASFGESRHGWCTILELEKQTKQKCCKDLLLWS